MFLVRLMYCSMQAGIGDADIEAILDRSRANNALDAITGALVYDGMHFLQILEGSRTAVSKRTIVICNDKRHKNIEIMDVSPIRARRFPAWTMKYVGETDLDQDIVSTYSAAGFDPRRMIDMDGVVDMMWRLAH